MFSRITFLRNIKKRGRKVSDRKACLKNTTRRVGDYSEATLYSLAV